MLTVDFVKLPVLDISDQHKDAIHYRGQDEYDRHNCKHSCKGLIGSKIRTQEQSRSDAEHLIAEFI